MKPRSAAVGLNDGLCGICDLAQYMRQAVEDLLIGRANPSFHRLRSLSVFKNLLPRQMRTAADRSEFNSQRELRGAIVPNGDFRVGNKR